MGILDDILKKNNGVNSFSPVSDQSIQDYADNTPAITDVNKDVPAQDNIQSEQSAAQPEIKYPDKPQGLQDSEYEHLLKYYTPESIKKFTAPFNPNGGENVLQRYYESTIPKPTIPDEKKTRNRRVLAGIADGVSMLSQMISAGSGAQVKERNDFSTSKVQQQEKEENNRYLQLSQRYNDGLFQARLKDFQKSLDDYNNGRKGIQSVLSAKQKLDQAQVQFEGKQRFNYDKLAMDQLNKEEERKIKEDNQKSLDRYRKAMEAQGWSRVADSRNRTSAYVKKLSSPGNGKNGNYQMVFGANPKDNNTDVQTDSFGNKVKVFEMNKGQIDQYARQALSDPQFMARHQDLILQKPDMLGSGSYKYKPNQDIAAAYLQEHYENSFNDTPSTPSTATQPIVNYAMPTFAMPKGAIEDNTEEVDSPVDDEEFPSLGSINF